MGRWGIIRDRHVQNLEAGGAGTEKLNRLMWCLESVFMRFPRVNFLPVGHLVVFFLFSHNCSFLGAILDNTTTVPSGCILVYSRTTCRKYTMEPYTKFAQQHVTQNIPHNVTQKCTAQHHSEFTRKNQQHIIQNLNRGTPYKRLCLCDATGLCRRQCVVLPLLSCYHL